jgi:hypothetical protein
VTWSATSTTGSRATRRIERMRNSGGRMTTVEWRDPEERRRRRTWLPELGKVRTMASTVAILVEFLQSASSTRRDQACAVLGFVRIILNRRRDEGPSPSGGLQGKGEGQGHRLATCRGGAVRDVQEPRNLTELFRWATPGSFGPAAGGAATAAAFTTRGRTQREPGLSSNCQC